VNARATYNRYGGVMHMLAALDRVTGKIYYRIRQRKGWQELLGLLKALRSRWPGQKLYVVLDNFSPHKHAEVRTWVADNEVELVFLPTYGSWLNWIESEFAALREFALNGTDHRTHEEQNAAIAAYVRWRNARAEPNTNFAQDSPIRRWTNIRPKRRDKRLRDEQEHADRQHHHGGGPVDAVNGRLGPVAAQHDQCVADGYAGGGQHEPAQ
jgi:transposase